MISSLRVDDIVTTPGCESYDRQKAVERRIVKDMTAHSIRQYCNRLLRSIGIRTERKKRHEFSVHGSRKYFKTRAEQSGRKPVHIEMLMGHSIGISNSYYKPTENELLQDYLRSEDDLTISHEIDNAAST